MENKKRNKVLKVLGLVGLFVLVFGLSYALFRITLTGRKKTRIKTANFGLTLTDINGNEETEGIAVDLQNALPETDEEGLTRDGYKFVVTNTGNIPASYELKLNSTGDLSTEYIKYALIEKDYLKKANGDYYMGGIYSNAYRYNEWDGNDRDLEPPLKLNSLTNNKLDSTTLLPGEKIEYELKLWLDYDATVAASNKTYEANIVIEGSQAEEYMTGIVGDNANYTLYKDGTLAITGSGSIKTVVQTETGATVYNNGGAISDINTKYLQEKGYQISNIDNGTLDFSDQNTYSMFGGIYLARISANYNKLVFISSLDDEGNDDIETMKIFGLGDYETIKNILNDIKNMPVHVNRLVIDEGIISMIDGYGITGGTGDFMITLPSTLIDIGMTSNMLHGEFEMYCGYGLIVPPNVSIIPENSYLGLKVQYLDLGNVRNINSYGIEIFYLKELNIPNTVNIIEENGVIPYTDMVINIDNTREYVEENWNANWLNNPNSHNVTVNYLR